MDKRIKEGEAFFAGGEIGEAERCFLEILSEEPKNKEAHNNLGVIAFRKKDTEIAINYFEKALEIDPYYREGLLNACAALKQLGRFEELSSLLEKAAQRFPRDKEIEGLLEEISKGKKRRTRIAFLCVPGFQSFLDDIVDFFREKYEVRTCYSNDRREIDAAVTWADLVWLEWANEMAIHVTNEVSCIAGKRVVCRIHSYEVLHDYLSKISWSTVNKTIFVADHVRKIAYDVHPELISATESAVIPNGLQLKKYPFKERRPGCNLAVVANISHKKNPSMWVELLNRLVALDENFMLHIAGNLQELRYKYYLEDIIRKTGIENHIKFCGWINDIPDWFEKENINYLLSTSVFESFGYGIAEAMAMGIKPLVYSFPGAEKLWPKDCIFRTIDEAIQMVRNKTYDPRSYRQFVQDRYSLKPRLLELESLLEGVMGTNNGKGPVDKTAFKTRQMSPCESSVPAALVQYHKPERNVIVTGIPRSGTSLFSVLLNNMNNAVCLNEILYDVSSLPQAFAEIRKRLVEGEPIPNRYDGSGALTSDTQNENNSIEYRKHKTVDADVVIGSKINIPYLNQIHTILTYGYKVIGIVRDPVYAIGSWNSEKALNIPEAQVTSENIHPRWAHFPFSSTEKIERQAQIWQFYAKLIWALRDKIRIYTYEQITGFTDDVFSDVCGYLNLPKVHIAENLKSFNGPSRYLDIEGVRRAVSTYCPIRHQFGYGNETKTKRAYEPKQYWEKRGAHYQVDTGRYNSDIEIPILKSVIETYDLNDSPLLEVGSGYGRIYQHIATGCSNVTMCDFSNAMRRECERITSVLPDYWDGKTLPYADSSFEMVILFSVLLHIPPEDIEDFLSEMLRVTRKYIFIATYTGGLPHTADHVFEHDYYRLFKENGLNILVEKKMGDGLRANWLICKGPPAKVDRFEVCQESSFDPAYTSCIEMKGLHGDW